MAVAPQNPPGVRLCGLKSAVELLTGVEDVSCRASSECLFSLPFVPTADELFTSSPHKSRAHP